MERAIGAYAEGRGVPSTSLEARWLLERDYDFDALGKHMSHVWRALDRSST